jgi:membrane protease YdiL (CAAX protease family)
MKHNSFSARTLNTWNRLPVLFRALLSGFLVSSLGVAAWTICLTQFAAPWSIFPMIGFLWLYWKYFSGSRSSGKAGESKRRRFRSLTLSPFQWKWGLGAAIAFVLIIQSSFVLTFRLIEFPSAQFTADYKILDKMPLGSAWVILIMSSIVAGICEETGYRGYLQVPLEKKYGSAIAIIISSIIFTLIHLNKTWATPIVPHIFFASVLLGILAYKSGSLLPGIIGHSILDIFNYSFWWSDLTGGFKKQTIFRTGIDLDFVVWSLGFLLGLLVFFLSINRLKRRPQESNRQIVNKEIPAGNRFIFDI